MDHEDAVGLRQAARERHGFLRVTPVVGDDELDREPADLTRARAVVAAYAAYLASAQGRPRQPRPDAGGPR